jgi:hypothetical protein
LALISLVFGLVAAPGSQADAPGASITFQAKASNGNSIFGIAFSKRADGRGSITLFVGKKGASVVYFAPATVVPSEVKTPAAFHPPSAVRADLGPLGRIDLQFAPSGVVKQEHSACDKTRVGFEAGSYQGTFEFHGEEGYAEATETSVPALIRPLLNLTCGGYLSGESGGPGLPGAKLGLLSKRGDRTVHLQANKNRPGAATVYAATIKERSGQVQIQRSVAGKAPAASFVFSSGLRLATFEPPAPFDGRAVFRRNASPANRWTGDLTVDFPGKSGVSLTDAFAATLVPAVQNPSHPFRLP